MKKLLEHWIEDWINDCLRRNNKLKQDEYFSHGPADHFTIEIEKDDDGFIRGTFEMWGFIITKNDNEWKDLKAFGDFMPELIDEYANSSSDPVRYVQIYEIEDKEYDCELELEL